MLPADQRLHARDPAGGEVEGRLPVHHELAAFERVAQAGFGVEVVEHPAAQRVVVDDGTVATAALATYIAVSASRSAVSGLSVSASASATPMLVPTEIS